jgi:hypothetical protein
VVDPRAHSDSADRRRKASPAALGATYRDDMNRAARPPEPEPEPADPPTDYTDAGVPTFDHVRDRIEERYTTALGTTELAEESAAGRSLAQQQEDRDKAARERLEKIRRSIRDD